MPKLLHTADWQLGLKLRRMEGDRGARARDARFRVVERIAAVAHEHQVDLVVVAGDVFDDNQVPPYLVSRARDVLAAFAPIPVVLMPGNHDAGVPGCVLERVVEDGAAGAHVHVLLKPEPVVLGGITVLPCPLLRRHTLEDLTAWVPERAPGEEAVRVVVAHGGAHGFGEAVETDTPNRVDVARLEAKGVDYVALGDWHGKLLLSARAAYSGAPEATKFEEKNPGEVLVVDLPAAGVPPSIQAVEVASTRWHQREVLLRSAEDLTALESWLDGLQPKGDTLVKLRLSGALTPSERVRLDAVLQRSSEALMLLYVRSDEVRTAMDEADLDAVEAPGFVGVALRDLFAASEDGDPASDAAARTLLRLIAEVSA